ncbi:hypothetical protein RR42_s0424 [Cupriavidus basilensis]|uniref:Uncharacterized protein n=1 Tax=Cupriavidus basilensis TaxID=68895 RepID=A0A0C4YH66_9BURK|nr:hypothetical protein RR42_s0424 [Cupriavidus basilensis]
MKMGAQRDTFAFRVHRIGLQGSAVATAAIGGCRLDKAGLPLCGCPASGKRWVPRRGAEPVLDLTGKMRGDEGRARCMCAVCAVCAVCAAAAHLYLDRGNPQPERSVRGRPCGGLRPSRARRAPCSSICCCPSTAHPCPKPLSARPWCSPMRREPGSR